ncbi:MAG: YceI family protein [Cytophagaceae bacterium]
MKNILSSGILVIVAFLAFSFNQGAVNYKVNADKSTITWTGKKVSGSHTGAVKISSGSISVNGDKVTAGTFDIDMTSISNTDMSDAGYREKLVGHLKSDDFFGTEKFPKATFVLSSATSKGNGNYDVTGKLTIKGITNDVTFPATIKADGKSLNATAQITVDRTKYGIKYGSGSFFDNLGDKAIDNNFTLDVKLVAAK